MNRCKNWFCARSNNNDYAEVSLNLPSKTSTTIGTATPTNTAHTTAATTNNIQHSAAAAAAQVASTEFVREQQTTAIGIGSTTTTPSSTTATTGIPTTTSSSAAAAPTSHVVTFLDDIPSGSNGVVSTTSRLVSTSEMADNNNLDGMEPSDDFLTFGLGPSPISLCDDTLPSSKNCYRLVMLGSSRVGKSSIVARFLGNRYEEGYTPTIEDFHRKLYRIRNEVYQLDILDTSGYHPFPAMRRLSFMTGDIFVLVFSMDSRESFEEVVRLRENILETKWAALNPGSGLKKKCLPKIPMIIAGNKCDRENKKVHLDEVMGYIAGQDNCCVFIECSAKQNFRIDDVFYELFVVSNLPLEMAPNHHRRVVSVFGAPSALPPHSSAGGLKKNALSIKRRFSDACGVVTPNARRPSIRTDLNLMRSKMGNSEGEGPRSSGRKFCIIM